QGDHVWDSFRIPANLAGQYYAKSSMDAPTSLPSGVFFTKRLWDGKHSPGNPLLLTLQHRRQCHVQFGSINEPFPQCGRSRVESKHLSAIEDVPTAELHFILQLGKGPPAVAEVNAEIFRSFRFLERSFKTSLCLDGVEISSYANSAGRGVHRSNQGH